MPQRHDYWTHGVATVLESPQLARLRVHCGLGTFVEQDANTSGWFHLPFPTPSMLQDQATALQSFALVAKVNENATVDLIHIRRGVDLVYNASVRFTNTMINQAFNIPDVLVAHQAFSGLGITLCVHVSFLDGAKRGRVEFFGAGAAFGSLTY